MATTEINRTEIKIHHIENINSLSSEELSNLKNKFINSISLYKKTHTFVQRKTIINALKPLLTNTNNISQYFANNKTRENILNNVTNGIPLRRSKIKNNQIYSNILINIRSKSKPITGRFAIGKEGDVFYPGFIYNYHLKNHQNTPDVRIKFKDNCGFIYLELDNIIIGYLLYIYSDTEKTHIYIEYVEVHPDYTGRRLCNKLIQELINLKPDINNFELFNAGGLPAFKCYVNTFGRNGFIAKNVFKINKKTINNLLTRTKTNSNLVKNGNVNNISRFSDIYTTKIIFTKIQT